MESFLNASKTNLTNLSLYRTVRVVMGNQTCDLDSAVCALVQALSEYVNAKKRGQDDLTVIPVMNVPEKEFHIKTEVVYCMKSHNIPLKLLTFRDQIDLQNLQNDKKLELILVDHHTLPNEDIELKSAVIAIIDHRPLDPAWSWPNLLLNVEIVGSCATLVTRNILRENPNLLDAQLSSLLRGPILVDTYNMSDKNGRVTTTDIDILNTLEQLGELTNRTEIFNKIMAAKTDISELTIEELIFKDLKITNNIPIPVFPLLVENLLTQENAREAIEKFGTDNNYPVIVFLGLDVCSERVSKDIAIFSTLYNQLGNDIIQALTSFMQPHLNLELVKEIREEKYTIVLYKLRNVKVTRKHILPIIQKTVLSHTSEKV